MRFNYKEEFQDWCILNNYEADEWFDETIVLEKSYSDIIQFYILNDDGTYAEVQAYRSVDEGLYDININRQTLHKFTEQVVVNRNTYK